MNKSIRESLQTILTTLKKKFIFFLVSLVALTLLSSDSYAQLPGYSFKKLITIDVTKVAGVANHTDFPVLISFTDADLQSILNTGDVISTSGFDIAFTAADGVTQLDHEIEKYDATTGEYIAWVRVPTLDFSIDTDIYMYYGNDAVTTDPSSTGTWDANYEAVWHLEESGSGIANELMVPVTVCTARAVLER